MGIAYFFQFLDKMVLSQATLFNLRQDLVRAPRYRTHGFLNNNLTLLGSNWVALLLDLRRVLFWLLLLELAKFLLDRSTSYRQVSVDYNVSHQPTTLRTHTETRQLPLGRHIDVSRCLH